MSGILIIALIVGVFFWLMKRKADASIRDIDRIEKENSENIISDNQDNNTHPEPSTPLSSIDNPKLNHLTLQSSLLIFLVAIIAFVAEIIISTYMGMAYAFSGDVKSASRASIILGLLILYTFLIGIAALISAVQSKSNQKNYSGYRIVKDTIRYGFIVLVILGFIMVYNIDDGVSSLASNNDASVKHDDTRIKKQYIQHLEIKDIKVNETLQGWGVFGEIKNHGDKTLKKIQITIYALDKNKKPVYEKTYHPVFVSEYSIREDTPLKPNYSVPFGVRMDDAPSEWNHEVEVQISDIEFFE